MNGNGYRLGAIGIISTFFIIIFSTVLMPMVIFRPEATPSHNDYTAEKSVADPIRGRRIYVREGCLYCHTQFTRLQDRGYGPLVKAGDFRYETPHQLGTARTGPDLTNEGGRMAEGSLDPAPCRQARFHHAQLQLSFRARYERSGRLYSDSWK
ncbi:MAG TPA: cbb3-type cytochrome c oxidase subunit II [Candidatus Melainabacteria bacterium]|nr:cbb3-type cytochrome c oxidase subunit II [Candidatus Melainabacteria bacterium]